MFVTSTQYSFSVASVKIILVTPSHIKQRELSLTPNMCVVLARSIKKYQRMKKKMFRETREESGILLLIGKNGSGGMKREETTSIVNEKTKRHYRKISSICVEFIS